MVAGAQFAVLLIRLIVAPSVAGLIYLPCMCADASIVTSGTTLFYYFASGMFALVVGALLLCSGVGRSSMVSWSLEHYTYSTYA